MWFIVVGILAAVAIPTYLHQRDKAAAGATKATMRHHVALIMVARENRQAAMKDITGWCSECPCRTVEPVLAIQAPGFADTDCGKGWRKYVDKMAQVTGEPVAVVERLSTDGWGYPILPDENEGEREGVCGEGSNWDMLRSPGANHAVLGASDNISIRVPPSSVCKPEPLPAG